MNTIRLHSVDGKEVLMILEGLCYFTDLSENKCKENTALLSGDRKQVLSFTETISDIEDKLYPKRAEARRLEALKPALKEKVETSSVKEPEKEPVKKTTKKTVEKE